MSKIFIPKSAYAELKIILNADAAQLKQMNDLFNSPKAVRRTSQDVLSEIVEILDIPIEDAYAVATLVDFVSQQKTEISNEEFILEIKTIGEKNVDDDSLKKLLDTSCQQNLLNLFGPKPIAELAKKKKKLETGLLKTLTKIEGTCELRPVFNLERSHIVDKVITVIARLTLEDDENDEKSIVIQLNEDSLTKFKDFLVITEKKKSIMEKEITTAELK